MAQTCFCRSGGLGPISFPLFQGTRLGAAVIGFSFSCIVALLRLLTMEDHARSAGISAFSVAIGALADLGP